MENDERTALAWAWVLEHADMIRAVATKQCTGTGLDAEDLHSDLLLRIVTRWHNYDSERSAPVTWVWWQAMAQRKEAIKRRSRASRTTPMEPKHHPVVRPAATAAVQLEELRAMATPDEWQAATLMGIGLEGAALGVACGCAPFSARRRNQRLQERYRAACAI